ncbi:MAG: molybdopterin-dependent oxidoreductase [Acidimicrobiales bacterium]
MPDRRRETDQERARRYAEIEADAEVLPLEEYRKHSRRALLTGGVAAVVAAGSYRWLLNRPDDKRANSVLRKGHEFNEALWRRLTRDSAMAPTFDRSESSELRVNGRHGIREDVDLDSWEMTVEGPDGTVLRTHVLSDVTAFPKVEMTVEHKCVEGWSHVVTWGGTRFSDFAQQYIEQLGETTRFVSLETPNGDYYVGMDIETMLHPQTMLTYELQGEPLSSLHGAPLRLTTPNKYGIKQLKRIGRIRFTNEQPDDYWGDRGYDWYAGL